MERNVDMYLERCDVSQLPGVGAQGRCACCCWSSQIDADVAHGVCALESSSSCLEFKVLV